MDETSPIVVPASPVPGMAVTFIRQLALILGGAFAAASAYRSSGLSGLLDFVNGDGFVTASAAFSVVVTVTYGQLREWKRSIRAITLASAVSDTIAVVDHRPLPKRLVSAVRTLFS